jgi:hypothetical protein
VKQVAASSADFEEASGQSAIAIGTAAPPTTAPTPAPTGPPKANPVTPPTAAPLATFWVVVQLKAPTASAARPKNAQTRFTAVISQPVLHKIWLRIANAE